MRCSGPIYEALLQYRAENNTLSHMPTRRRPGFYCRRVENDGDPGLHEVPGLDDLHNPSDRFRRPGVNGPRFGAREGVFLVMGYFGDTGLSGRGWRGNRYWFREMLTVHSMPGWCFRSYAGVLPVD